MGIYYDRANALVTQGRYDLAVRELHSELECEPNNASAHALLGVCLAEGRQFEEAIAAAREGIRLAPDFAYAQYALSFALNSAGKPPTESRPPILEALRLDPSFVAYYEHLAYLHAQDGKWKDAIRVANEGLQLDPESADCHLNRAIALNNLGYKRESRAALEAALSRNPSCHRGHGCTGLVLLHQNRPKEALSFFQEALRLNPTQEWLRKGSIDCSVGLVRRRTSLMLLSAAVLICVLLPAIVGGLFPRLADEPVAIRLVCTISAVTVILGLLLRVLDSLVFLVLSPSQRMLLRSEDLIAARWQAFYVLAMLIAGSVYVASGLVSFIVAGLFVASVMFMAELGSRMPLGRERSAMTCLTGVLFLAGISACTLSAFVPPDDKLGAAILIGPLALVSLGVIYFSDILDHSNGQSP